ncbi:MAG: tetratricopeptide repeat protein, partial [Victivallales bacterium]|nr:tetratricopeptide repeat protein [Victivallales bacterium]
MTRRILLLISLTAILTTAVLHSQQPVLQPQAVQLAEVRSPEEMDEHITGLYKRKFYDLAQKEVETFLQRYPNHDRAQVISEILIDCLCRQQLNDQAIFLLRNFLKVHSAHEQWSRFALQLGELLYAKGTYAEAESCFAQAAEKSRENYLTAFAEYNRALCLIKLERRPEARTILESLAAQKLEGKGDTAETQALHLGILVKSRLFAAQFKSEDKDYKGALDIYQKLLASGKLDENARSETLEHAATISFEYLNDYKGAALFAGRHYAEFPASPRRAYIRQIFLYSLFHSRNYSQFLKSFREYLQETPDGATSSMLMMCIQAAAEQKLPEEELKWINILLAFPKAEPRHVAEARNQRVFVLYRMGQEKEAAAEALKFISEYPSNTAGYNNVLQLLAHISVNAGDFTAAAKYLETLLGLVKDNPREYSIVAGQLASAYQNLKEWSKAADAAVKAASTAEKEQQPALLLYAAQCADYAGDFKLTVQLCDTAVQRAPENPDVHNKALEIKYNSAVSKQHTADAAKIAREAVQRFSAASQHVIWLYRLAN